MSERILTLFGEEILPQPAPAPKSRGKKKADDKKESEQPETAGTEEVTQPEAAPEAAIVAMEPAAEALIAPAVLPVTEPLQPTTPAQVADQLITAEAQEANKPPVSAEANEGIMMEQEAATSDDNAEVDAEAQPLVNGGLPDDWKGDKQYYSIGEVAALLQVKTSNIRFWTNEFKMKVRTNRKGDRMYTEPQVREMRTIYNLVKERGFTLNGAKARLKTAANKDVATVDLKTMLTGLRSKLVAIKNRL